MEMGKIKAKVIKATMIKIKVSMVVAKVMIVANEYDQSQTGYNENAGLKGQGGYNNNEQQFNPQQRNQKGGYNDKGQQQSYNQHNGYEKSQSSSSGKGG